MSDPTNQNDAPVTDSSDAAVPAQTQEGYAQPLFEDSSKRWSDERMGIESVETRYHDQNQVLEVAQGLCYDIFFQAGDVKKPGYKDMPDAFAPVPESEQKEGSEPVDYKKPLDSKGLNRSYILDPDVEEQKPAKKRRSRGGRGNRSERSGRPRRRSGGKRRRRR